MFTINENFLQLSESYLFSTISRKVAHFSAAHPEARIIRLGIGDVTLPLTPTVISAMHKAVDEMASKETFRGYGPERGYDFLLETIAENDFQAHGVEISPDEIFVSDGSKNDIGNILDILGNNNVVGIPDPVYPVYMDTNLMNAVNADRIVLLPCDAENDFLPQIPETRIDVIYLCYPNNPTGTVMKKSELKKWVDYALENESLILFDAAYEAYISEADIPHSIFEIEGARNCAIEFRSYSKSAGFTGVRSSYTVVPHGLNVKSSDGRDVSLNHLWVRRQATKFNGTAYIVQRATQAVYTPEGKAEVRGLIDYYMDNARILRDALSEKGWIVYGGINSPYIWLKCPNTRDSWQFFDELLHECHLVGTPGVGFGPNGEGYFRLTAFNSREQTREAVERIRAWKI